MTYRPADDGIGTCRRCGADLADDAAFCAECGAPTYVAASSAGRPAMRASRERRWWVPIALVVGGIAAIGGGALLAVALGDRDPVATDPSATPAASAAASVPATSAAPSEQPTPSPSPTPAQAAVIPNRSIVEVATDALNLRRQPNDAASVLAELPSGRRLFTIGEPTDAGELRWYRVGTVAAEGCFEDCNLVGFVATPRAAEEDAWLAEVEVDCPSSPMTATTLSALPALEALHCFGRNELVVTGTVDTPCCDPPSPIEYSPEWLADPNTPAFLRFEGPVPQVIGFRPHPDADLEVPERGDVVEVTGHFEDPAATSCRATVSEEADEPVQPPDPAWVVLTCRATFVWTEYEVTGFEDLGPCCGGLPTIAAAGTATGRIGRIG